MKLAKPLIKSKRSNSLSFFFFLSLYLSPSLSFSVPVRASLCISYVVFVFLSLYRGKSTNKTGSIVTISTSLVWSHFDCFRYSIIKCPRSHPFFLRDSLHGCLLCSLILVRVLLIHFHSVCVYIYIHIWLILPSLFIVLPFLCKWFYKERNEIQRSVWFRYSTQISI